MFDSNEKHRHMKRIGSTYAYNSTLGSGKSFNISFETVNKLTYTRNEGSIDTFIKIFLFIAGKSRRMKHDFLAILGVVVIPDKVYYILIHSNHIF